MYVGKGRPLAENNDSPATICCSSREGVIFPLYEAMKELSVML